MSGVVTEVTAAAVSLETFLVPHQLIVTDFLVLIKNFGFVVSRESEYF